MPENGYDVIVLGGGVAGCVLAARLSEDPGRRVCLVEAGPDYGPAGDAWPAEVLDARLLPREDAWEFDDRLLTLRARVIGGSSSINGCWHTWGADRDAEEWAAAGGPRWSPDALEPARSHAAATMRLRPVPDEEMSAWQLASLAGAAELGYAEIEDMSRSLPARGAGRPPINAIGDQRWNAAFGYLDPARDRPNLTVRAGQLVDRLVLRGALAAGVEVVSAGRRTTLRADRYVLAAGAYGTPAILLRSGIGPAGDLTRLGIGVAVDRPGVGRNLIDHPGITLPLRPTDELARSLAEQEEKGRLYPSQVALKAGSSHCPDDAWDLHILPTAGPPLVGTLPPGQYAVGMSVFLMKPRSRGSVTVTSADPTAAPRVRHDFLSEEGDIAVLREGMVLAEAWARTPSLGALADFAADWRPTGDGALSDWMRRTVHTYWHPVGTCAMGSPDDDHTVVDGSGRVVGLDNVTVADASILPTIPRANTQLPVLVVAETLAAELVR